MDELDRKLLEALQRELPIEAAPYERLARDLGSDEATVFSRVMAMLDDGRLRRLGASFDSRRLGCAATLVALRVPAARVAEVAEIVNGYDEVTHNYERSQAWNLWFTLIARDQGRLEAVLAEILRRAGLAKRDCLNLPAEKLFKIDVQFSATAAPDEEAI